MERKKLHDLKENYFSEIHNAITGRIIVVKGFLAFGGCDGERRLVIDSHLKERPLPYSMYGCRAGETASGGH
jgi:hypothetical protein